MIAGVMMHEQNDSIHEYCSIEFMLQC